MSTVANPPVARQIPHTLEIHGDRRIDPYYWLGNREDPQTIAYLEAENKYAEAAMEHTRELQEKLFDEMRSRIVESEESAPVPHGPFVYYHRLHKGDNYRMHYRKPRNLDAAEELLIDENELARNYSYFRLYALEVSPNHRIAGYATDTTGNETCTIRILDLDQRKILPDLLENASGDLAWSNSSTNVYYTTLDSIHRPWRLYRHQLGDDSMNDQLLFEEPDEAFYLNISKSDSDQYLLVELHSIDTSEVHLLDANDDGSTPQLIFARKSGIEYQLEDRGDDLYVRTNEDALNFRLMKTSIAAPDKACWETVVAHSDHTTITGFRVFREFIAVAVRFEGLPTVRFITGEPEGIREIAKPPKIQELHLGNNREFDTSICRVNGNSLDMPISQYDFDMTSGEHVLIKIRPVGGGYDSSQYATERHAVKAEDGREIPLDLVYRKDAAGSRPAPILLNGYGSYGYSYPLYFSATRLSLLDRGIIYAISHPRGGGEMGKKWYHDGKLERKKNTFTDFAACAKFLLNNGITSGEQLAISGGSAGGLVVGNFLNNYLQLCKAAIAHVPFVDIVTTILDDTLPLSILERDEWGDPNDPQTYEYMKSYSPYDNVRASSWPALFITAGLNDPRVGYWEPAKWAAKIRTLRTNDAPLILKTEMHSGHGGKSGRYEALRETALEYAFIIDQLVPCCNEQNLIRS